MARPKYVLSAAPNEPCALKNFYSDGEGTIRYLFEHPGKERKSGSGWNFNTQSQAELVNGEALGIRLGDDLSLRLYEDGVFVMIASSDDDYLCWGRYNDKEILRLNPVAITEITQSFAAFYSKILPSFEEGPKTIRFQINLINFLEGPKVQLLPGEVESIYWSINREGKFLDINNKIDKFDLPIDTVKDYNKTAYLLIERLYRMFNHLPDAIPYTVIENNVKRISMEFLNKK